MSHHKIIIGDCLEGMKLLDDESVDLVLTDPPFGISRKSNFHTQKDRKGRTGINFGEWDNPDTIIKALPDIERVLSEKGGFLCFYDQMKITNITTILNPRRCIYWKKTNPMPVQQNPFPISAVETILYSTKGKTGTFNGKGEHNWFECKSPLPFERYHPTQKPEDLIEWLMGFFSNEGDVILDPFAGSFTTTKVATRLNRDSISIEINGEYWEDMGKKRLRFDQPTLDNSVSFEVIEL